MIDVCLWFPSSLGYEYEPDIDEMIKTKMPAIPRVGEEIYTTVGTRIGDDPSRFIVREVMWYFNRNNKLAEVNLYLDKIY